MIQTSNSDYAFVNPSITKYTYAISIINISSSPITFNTSSYVTDTMRSSYGYSSSSKIVGVEIRLLSFCFEVPVASGLNTRTVVSLFSDATAFQRLGTGGYSMVAPVIRDLASATTAVCFIRQPVSTMFLTLVPSSYSTANFSFNVTNAVSGSVISTSDYLLYSFEIIEYVSQY